MREINPDSCVIPNTGGGASSPLDMRRIGELAPTLMADRQSRTGLMAPWANGKNAKEYRAALGGKPVVGIFSVGLDGVHRWKDAVQNPEETRLWVADGIANGMRPWFTKFGGVINDPRWLEAGRGDLLLVPRGRALPAQRAAAGAGRRSSTRSRRAGSTPRRARRTRRRTRASAGTRR